MSATISDYTLQLSGRNLQFGVSSIPIWNVTRFWVLPRNNEIVLQFNSCKGFPYRGNLTLQFQTVEKTKECVRLLLLHTSAIPAVPKTKLIVSDDRSFTIHCLNEEEAKKHAEFFAGHYFVLPKNICTGSSYTISGEGQADFLAAKEAMISRLEIAQSETLTFYQLVQSSDPHQRHFIADPNGIFRLVYDSKGKKESIPTEDLELVDWIEQSGAETKENWALFLRRLDPENEKYRALIEKLRSLLRIEPFYATRMRRELHSFVAPLMNDQEFQELLKRTFKLRSDHRASPCREFDHQPSPKPVAVKS